MSNLTLSSPDKKLGWFLLLWLLLNITHASLMEVYEDEAYYWLYSRFLDVGYFDHPPMIALFIKAGYALFQNTLGLRLITILAAACSVFLLWKIVKEYATNLSLFILVFSSFLLFHLYSFISTPDAPLFFFSVLFFYCYQRYLKQDNFKWAFCLAIVIAGLLYSKYHGVLILLFTLLSNQKLLKRTTFWVIVIAAFFLYVPHIWWQIQHDFPTVAYQLSDRSASAYKVSVTTEYLCLQLVIAAPLIGWYFFICAAKAKAEDQFIRSLKFTFYGVFIFFLVSTLKGKVEAHWTLIGLIPLFILTYICLCRSPVPKWVTRLAIVNVSLIILVRLFFIIPSPFTQKIRAVKKINGSDEWTKQIRTKAGAHYVLFNQGFQQPSKYNFYTRDTKGFAYNSMYYRKNQYNLWPVEDSLRGKKIYFVSTYPHVNIGSQIMFIILGQKEKQDSFFMEERMHYGRWIDNVRLYQKVNIKTDRMSYKWKPAEVKNLELTIDNPYQQTINFSNANQEWKCFFEYAYLRKGEITGVHSLGNILEPVIIPANKKKSIRVNIKAPLQTGKYKLLFSLRTEPFPGTRNSRMIDVTVR